MYFFYCDESGSRDPHVGDDKTAPTKDYLYVLLAVGMWEGNWRRLDKAVSHLKLELADYLRRNGKGSFDLTDCEVKSTWLRVPSQREKRSPFLHALSEADLLRLTQVFYAQLENCKSTVFAVVIDKRHLLDHMTHETLHKKAYEMLLERIEHFMTEYHPKHNALIVMDDCSAELNRAVAMKHAYFQRAGNQNVKFRHIVEYPFFTVSELSNGVQLADLCAYNVYRAFKSQDFRYSFFQSMLPYFYKRQAGAQLDGLKVWPDQSALIQFARAGWTTFQQQKTQP